MLYCQFLLLKMLYWMLQLRLRQSRRLLSDHRRPDAHETAQAQAARDRVNLAISARAAVANVVCEESAGLPKW